VQPMAAMDLRYALRVLFRSPGFAAIAILTLALGIGINTVVFTLYNAVALKPIAAHAPGELVRVFLTQNEQRSELFNYAQFAQIQQQSEVIADAIASSDPQVVVGRLTGDAETFHTRVVSSNYFTALGVATVLGRSFLADDTQAAVISHEFWTRKLGSDPNILSKSIRVRGASLAIIGVAAAGFAGTGVPALVPDFWIPAAAQTVILPGLDWMRDEKAKQWQVIARRRASVSTSQAAAALEVLGRSWPRVDGKPIHVGARPATFFQTDAGEFQVFGAVCGVLMLAVGLILLIGSLNLVNLVFARNSAREREFAVRRALGAGRLHLLRQLCTESVLMGIVGGAAGMLLSLWACDWIRLGISGLMEKITGGQLGVSLDVSPDWHVFTFTAALSIFTGAAIGLWPAIRASLPDVNVALKASGGALEGRRKRNLLIAAQVAACLILLAGAGLLFHGVWRSADIDTGFDMAHTLVIGINPQTESPTPAGQLALLKRAADRVRSLPAVSSVTWSDRVPFLGHGMGGFENERGNPTNCLFALTTDGYFETLGIPLVAGRSFTRQEVESDAPVVVINEIAARQAWPGQDPIGHRISGLGWLKRQGITHDAYTVIGVAKGVRSTFLSKPDEGFIYLPRALTPTGMTLMAHTQIQPENATHAVLAELGAISPNLPSQTFVAALDKAPVQIQRLMAEAPAVTALLLGGLALLLAALGVFGVVSQLVTQRTREIAIRVSLGAQIPDVIRMVVGQTLRPVLLGSLVGLAGAIGLSVLLGKMLVTPEMPDLTYGSGAFDPFTFLAVLGTLTVVIALASFIPVRRATRIDPADALRND
jgi:predicted permease